MNEQQPEKQTDWVDTLTPETIKLFEAAGWHIDHETKKIIIGPGLTIEATKSPKGFQQALREKNKMPSYPQWLQHLQTKRWRILYSAIPFGIIWLWVELTAILTGNGIHQYFFYRHGAIIMWFLSLIPCYIILTLLAPLFIRSYKPWRERSALFRICCFLSVCWIVVIELLAIFVDTDYFGSYKIIQYTDHYGTLDGNFWDNFMIISCIPVIFFNFGAYIYQRYIK
jgi:hypothetical protein